jgi:uroporphyrinogen-III synthase
MKITSLFVSSTSKNSAILIDFCEKTKLSYQFSRLIDFRAVPAALETDWDVVFFTSPRSVDFFLKQYSLSRDKSIACIGEATRSHLETLGHRVAFAGKDAGSPTQVAAEFSLWLSGRKVLIPQSTRSNKTIEQALPNHQSLPLVVYETQLNPCTLPQFSVYVFTSPSNVESFLLLNTIPSDAIVVAWGETTARYLEERKQQVNHVLSTASYEELTAWLIDTLAHQQ